MKPHHYSLSLQFVFPQPHNNIGEVTAVSQMTQSFFLVLQHPSYTLFIIISMTVESKSHAQYKALQRVPGWESEELLILSASWTEFILIDTCQACHTRDMKVQNTVKLCSVYNISMKKFFESISVSDTVLYVERLLQTLVMILTVACRPLKKRWPMVHRQQWMMKVWGSELG